ncbi:hypothetical protein PsorP6_013315 [Peronosclerospora sorghi]|uniref:Uncharacterized protein n=1 Tax=Peronosclerospora sorghi TaxID=230839 RepID=A0ACC0WG90_9STRA|nr:hypothetical protein PsorP6_013315 [Peronosclerospora sorghi]
MFFIFVYLFFADNALSRWQNIFKEAGDTEHVVSKWEDSLEYGGQVREMKYRAKSTSALGPATTMAEQIVHVPFSSQDRDKLEMDRLEIEHKVTLLEIPYGDCFHVETVYAIEPRTNATGLHLLPRCMSAFLFEKYHVEIEDYFGYQRRCRKELETNF